MTTLETSSVLLLSDMVLLAPRISCFSARHKLHLLVVLVYSLAFRCTFHWILYLVPLSFRDQMCFARAELFLYHSRSSRLPWKFWCFVQLLFIPFATVWPPGAECPDRDLCTAQTTSSALAMDRSRSPVVIVSIRQCLDSSTSVGPAACGAGEASDTDTAFSRTAHKDQYMVNKRILSVFGHIKDNPGKAVDLAKEGERIVNERQQML